MLTLAAKIRQTTGKKVRALRKEGILPVVLYGPKIKPLSLEIDLKDFEKVFKEAGESSLIKLNIQNQELKNKLKKKEFQVLIHDIQRHPLSEKPLHVDFYQPPPEEEVTVTIPLVFLGEPPAVKELGGILVKNITELEIKAKPLNLEKKIKVNVEGLKTFDDHILIKDLRVGEGIEILKEPEEVVALVVPPKEEVVEEKVGQEVVEKKVEKKEEPK